MYGLINRFKAHPGQRDALAASMLADFGPMAGCISFIVAEDPTDPDALWITEVWTDKASHTASMDIPSVKASIEIGMPLVADFGQMIETRPTGGTGITGPTP
jgi:quinol monooxygenase YgiN